jgi:hypothetical protein
MIQVRVYWTPGIPGGWITLKQGSKSEARTMLYEHFLREGEMGRLYELREVPGSEERMGIAERMKR